MIREILGRLSAGDDLSREEMADAVGGIMQGEWTEAEIALLLTGLRAKGETVDELTGAAQAMRERMVRIPTTRQGLLDTCGTGGDASGTFNISTAAALVTAAAGVPVAKHGNRRASSTTGSADVLAELGVNVQLDIERVGHCLDELGICFCFAPLCHAAMKHVAPVRQKLGVPTIFNLLGPLANPASASYQLLGVGQPRARPLLAGALANLGVTRAVVVHGDDGLDEVSLFGTTQATLAQRGTTSEFTWQPADFGLLAGTPDPGAGPADRFPESIRVSGPKDSAHMIRAVLDRSPGPARDIVVLNAAAALWAAQVDADPAICARHAAAAIDSGAAADLLARLVVFCR